MRPLFRELAIYEPLRLSSGVVSVCTKPQLATPNSIGRSPALLPAISVSLLHIYPDDIALRRIQLPFLSYPITFNNIYHPSVQFTSRKKKEHEVQASVRIESHILGATLSSELICRQGRNPLERTTAKSCHLTFKKVPRSDQGIKVGTYKLSFQNYLFRQSKAECYLSRKGQ